MIFALRIFFGVVFVSMLGVTSWAGWQVPLWSIPRSVGGHPWFIATLFDAYWGFFIFYAWLCYKEPSWLARVVWFVAIVLLGNMAMAAYGMMIVLALPTHASAAAVLLRGEPVSLAVPSLLLAGFGIVAGVAAAG
jgi:hypothetical protein